MLLNRFNECYRVETGRLLPYTIVYHFSVLVYLFLELGLNFIAKTTYKL